MDLAARSAARISRGLWWSLFALAALPLLDLAYLTLRQALGVNPQEILLRATGTWALTLLIAALAAAPLCRFLNWPDLLRARRMLGLWAFAYAAIHLAGFWAFEHDFIWTDVLRDALKRPFVTVGLTCFLLMLPLALTSTNRAMRWLGRSWKKLHLLIYAIAPLACLHFYLHRAGKNNFLDPSIALVLVLGFIGLKLFTSRSQGSEMTGNRFNAD